MVNINNQSKPQAFKDLLIMRLLPVSVFVAIFLLVIFRVANQYTVPPTGPIYWGAYIKGDTYGLNDAPWNINTISTFEAHAGKKMSIIHWGQPWWNCSPDCGYRYFLHQQPQYDRMRKRGYIPMVDWGSYDLSAEPMMDQPRFALRAIIRGDHDGYIRRWAEQARDWGHPFFLRFNWEMNGDWFPWSEKENGNQPGEYVQAWQHVYNIFMDVGAHNVTWVWCVNTLYGDSIPLDRLYPGDDFVDWTCMDGYNRGEHPVKNDRWINFRDLFSPTYNSLWVLAPTKPIMIGEVASTEIGGSKATWIRNAFSDYLPNYFPRVKAVVWFNWNNNGVDWVIESSPSAQAAFAKGIASPYYARNDFASLSVSPIPPIDQLSR